MTQKYVNATTKMHAYVTPLRTYVCVGFVTGIFCSELYVLFTGKDFFNVWHDRLFGIISVGVGLHALCASRKNACTPFLLDTLGGLVLIGTGVYLVLS